MKNIARGSDSPLGKLEATRRKITSIKEAIAALDDALPPRAQAESRIDTFVEDLAAQSPIDAETFTYRDFRSPSVWELQPEEIVSLLATVAGDQLKSHLKRGLDEIYDGAHQLAHEARLDQQTELEAQLMKLEIDEERQVVQVLALGLTVARRGDADPRALIAAAE